MSSVPSTTRDSYGHIDVRENNKNESVFRCHKCNFETVDRNLLKLHCKEHKEITDLNINCMENIFKYLSPDALAAINQTCKLYKTWTEQYVTRGKVCVPLQMAVNGPNINDHRLQFTIRGHNNYAIRFHKIIPYLELDLLFKPSVDRTVQLFWFIRDNCADSLKHLTISEKSIKEHWLLTFMIRQVRPILVDDVAENNERIAFYECIGIIGEQIKDLILLKTNFVGSIELLLERCEEIKVFIFHPANAERLNNNLLRRTYRKLDVFILTGQISCDRLAHFADFLQENPQLKAVISKTVNITNIRDILLTVNRLPFAAIQLSEVIFQQIGNAFETCCERKNIQSLEVVLHNIDQMVLLDIFRMKYVSGLHCNQFSQLTRIKEIPVQPNLKRLCVKIEEKISIQLNELMDQLPECTELRVKGWPNVTINDLLMPFISRHNKLENIYLDSEALLNFTTNDAMELNAARSQLEGVSRLNIHLSKETTITDIMGSCVMNMVNVQLEREEKIKCPLCSSDHKKNLQFLRMNNIYKM